MMDQVAMWTGRVGERVVVRRRIADGSATDVVGVLLAVEEQPDGAVLVVDGRGGPVDVRLGDVLAGRVVPPRPSRRAPPHRALSVVDLEHVAALHWRAPETEQLGSWLLRAGGGFTGRANSALAAGDPGMPLPAALDVIRSWYAHRNLPGKLALPRPDPGAQVPADADQLQALAADVAAHGWVRIPGAGARVLTAAVNDVVTAVRELPGVSTRLDAEPGEKWLALYHYRGNALPPIGRRLLLSAPEQVFAAALDVEDTLVAIGRGSLGGGWAGLAAVEVDPAWRRLGLARLLLARVAQWAAAAGVRSIFVQVGELNDAALALYESAGFTVHHRYDYLTPPPTSPAPLTLGQLSKGQWRGPRAR
jgi:N-acetylglutamate synthase